jgi:hypothetical protein
LSVSRWRSRKGVGRFSSVAAIALSLVTFAGALPASAATYHASQGDVTATLTYRGSYNNTRDMMLTITKSGVVVSRGAVTAAMCASLCWSSSASGTASGSPVRVVRLEAGSPDVVLGLFSGGAHCCFVDEIFVPSTSGSYVKTELNLGDPGAMIEKLPGAKWPVVVTADDTFAYAFTDFAASGLPIKILQLSGHKMLNVTRLYPSQIRADARRLLGAFYQQKSDQYADSVGIIAAWTADEYLLGRAPEADQFLHQQAAAGHLNGLLTPSLKGTTFIGQLQKFLQREGY